MPPHTARGRWITPLLAGAVLGPALQVQQEALWPWPAYPACMVAGLFLLAWRAGRARVVVVLAAAALLAFGACGWRAERFLAQGLDPALEGRDLGVVGVIAAMPQTNEAGVRFRFEVESATTGDGVPARLPPLLSLGWYGGPLPMGSELLELQDGPAPLHAGERWRFAVRLKAPHGTVNPHGFDYELWLWEQGLQATGWVRAGPRDPPPQRLAATWAHPVERARQQVRDAIVAQLPDRQTAGVLAALVTGDQNAIDGLCKKSLSGAPATKSLISLASSHVSPDEVTTRFVRSLRAPRSANVQIVCPQHFSVPRDTVA